MAGRLSIDAPQPDHRSARPASPAATASRCSKCCSTGPARMRSTRNGSPPTSTSSSSDFADLPLKDIRVGALIARITAIVREHGIVLPSDLTLMFKALITLEGAGRKYDPDFAPRRPAEAVCRPRARRALRAGGDGAPRRRQPRPVPRPDRLDAARCRAAAEGRAPRPHAHRSRSEAARQLRAASSTARSTASPSAS